MLPPQRGLLSVLIYSLLWGTCLRQSDARGGRRHVESTAGLTYWPGGLIPYTFPPTFRDIMMMGATYEAGNAHSSGTPDLAFSFCKAEEQENLIRVGMDRWEQVTCLKFVPWNKSVRKQLGTIRFLKFVKAFTCFSRHGMYAIQPQPISIGSNCAGLKAVIHELGHAIGMLHTMERNDRDTYVSVQYDNINPDSRDNFNTVAMKGKVYPYYGTPYDYRSIMHYGANYWSINGKPAMVTRDPAYQSVIGKAKTASFYDAVYVNRAYNCTDRCEPHYLECNNGGVAGSTWEGDCFCLCPDGFMGAFCETAVPGFRHIVSWDCGTAWDYANGNCYQFFPSVTVGYSFATKLCRNNGGNLATFTNNEEVKWLRNRIGEDILLESIRSFWVGVKRKAGQTTYHLPDGSVFNASLMPLHEMGTSRADGCGTTNGQSLVIGSCESKVGNGVICSKPFDPDCGGRYRLTPYSISIQSPGFPSGYPPSTKCEYVFQTNSDMKVEIHIDSFDMMESTTCGSDFLEIRLSTDITKQGQLYCGPSLLNKTLSSEGNVAILTFQTNIRDSSPGFRATVRAVPMRDVSNNVITNTGSTLLDVFLLDNSDSNVTTESHDTHNAHAAFLQVLWKLFGSITISSIF